MSKIALVTGANRGIGLETAKQLADLNYETILTSRSAVDAEVIAFIKKPNVHHHLLDVNSDHSIDSLKEFVKNKFGRLDILINNAAINYDDWQKTISPNFTNIQQTMDTNLFGAWKMCLAFIPLMQQNNFGRIVNVSSGAGALNGMSGGTPGYGISKAALNALTIKLGKELQGSGILVNAVCPGWVRTDMGGPNAPRSVDQGAKSVLWAATLKDDGPTSGFFRDGNPIDW